MMSGEVVTLHFHVTFDPPEVQWAGVTRERLITPGSEDETVRKETITYLDIGLSQVDCAELATRLAAERDRRPPTGIVRSKTNDNPVRLVEGNVLRIVWRGSTTLKSPSIKTALLAISRFATIHNQRELLSDMVTSPQDKQAMDSQILDLAARGETIAAMKVARRRYGCSLAEAKKLVDDLLANEPTSGD